MFGFGKQEPAPEEPKSKDIYPSINRRCILPNCGIPIRRPGASFCVGHFHTLPQSVKDKMKRIGMDALPDALNVLFQGAPVLERKPPPERKE